MTTTAADSIPSVHQVQSRAARRCSATTSANPKATHAASHTGKFALPVPFWNVGTETAIQVQSPAMVRIGDGRAVDSWSMPES